jgi:GDPmannose 4,6-dehydratase
LLDTPESIDVSRKALILGIAGQDGSYLAEHLLESGYEVEGVLRRNSTPEHQESRIHHLVNSIKTHYGDVTDASSIAQVFQVSQPDVVYNLAAQSHVRISYDVPEFTVETNGVAVLKLLEMIRQQYPSIKFYQASSSEMFGTAVDPDGFQRETTPMHPVSPYGCAKLFAYSAVRNYRHAYKLFATNGILFNHESPRRGTNFVTSKVVKSAVAISYGLEDKLTLGNLDSYRDWGHSRDYVRAMRLMMEMPSSGDYIVATGQTFSVRDLCDRVFSKLGMNYRDYVVQDPKYMRPEELPYLRGDATRFKEQSGWQSEVTFDNLIDEMLEYWLKQLST